MTPPCGLWQTIRVLSLFTVIVGAVLLLLLARFIVKEGSS